LEKVKVIVAKRLFLEQLKRKGYTEATLVSKAYCLNTFFSYLKQRKGAEIESVTETRIRGYVRQRYYHMNAKGKQNIPETRNNEIEVVKQLFSFLTAQEHLATDPSIKVEYIKEPKVQIPKDVMTRKELEKLFKQPDMGTVLGYRDRICMELLYATGMRRRELTGLDVSDINLKEQLIYIRKGKGQKDRMVPVNDTATQYLSHYINYIRPKMMTRKKKPEALILNERGTCLHYQAMGDRLRKHIKTAVLKKHITLHSFRHTCATHLIQRGMPVRQVQELLGHKQLDTTIRYLQLSMKDLQKEYRKSHPRERVL
jgi:integrase/recombinase XerD